MSKNPGDKTSLLKTNLIWLSSVSLVGIVSVIAARYFLETLIHNPAGIIAAKSAQFPWHVRVTSNSSPCGGTVIAKDWILTAAHCVKAATNPAAPSNVFVLAGSKSPDGRPGKAIKVILHSDYSTAATERPRKFDIALIKFPMTLGENIALIDRALVADESTSSDANVAGWICIKPVKSFFEGFLRLLTSCENTLYYTGLGIPSFGNCTWDASFICAGGNVDSKLPGVDPNDSGGGLATGTERGAKLLGIAIRGDTADKYTRVSYYLDWIEDCMGGGGEEARCSVFTPPG